jgi:hypothetical protein
MLHALPKGDSLQGMGESSSSLRRAISASITASQLVSPVLGSLCARNTGEWRMSLGHICDCEGMNGLQAVFRNPSAAELLLPAHLNRDRSQRPPFHRKSTKLPSTSCRVYVYSERTMKLGVLKQRQTCDAAYLHNRACGLLALSHALELLASILACRCCTLQGAAALQWRGLALLRRGSGRAGSQEGSR